MNKSTLFIIIAFAVNWGMAAAYYFLGYTLESPEYAYFSFVYMLTPLFIAFVVQKIIYREQIIGPFLLAFKLNKWMLIGWFTPVVISLLAFGIGLLMPGISFSTGMESMFDVYLANKSPEFIKGIHQRMDEMPVHPFFMTLVNGLVTGATVNAVIALGQEVAWRGFLLNAFKSKGYFNASMLTGLVWGLWYAPLILMGQFYPQHPIAGVFVFTLICVFLSPIFTFITLKSGSIYTAAIMNGTLNATAVLSFMMLAGGSDLTLSINGLSGIGAILIIMAVVMDYDRLTEAKIFRD